MTSSQALSIHLKTWILIAGVIICIPDLHLFLYLISDHCYNKINQKKQIHIQKIKSIPALQHLLHVWNFGISNSRSWTPSSNRKPHLLFPLETNLSQSIPLHEFTIISYSPSVLKQDHQNRHGYGVGDYVKDEAETRNRRTLISRLCKFA